MAKNERSFVTQHADAVEVQWQNGKVSRLPNLWLRDNCSCDDCRIPQTSEKSFLISSVKPDLRPADVSLQDDELHITWPDGHSSHYRSDDIFALDSMPESRWVSWGADFLPLRTDYESFLANDDVAAEALADFLRHGACILERAPVHPGTLEDLSPRFGPVREVLFERIHNVEVYADGYNVAHTSLEVPPHNDFASYSWPPSVQALHMLVNDTAGGESTLVDGFNVLRDLRRDHTDMFESLCSMSVPFRQFDANAETHAVAPLVRCDTGGEIVALRFSNQLMQAINPDKPEAGLFYKAYHELCRRLTDPANRVSFRLQAGEILLVAGHRVLHGRMAFEPTARRHLQDAYYDLDNVKNHLFVLERNSGVRVRDRVRFNAMEHGIRSDYDLVFAHDAENIAGMAERVLGWLQSMDGDSPYKISRLDHCLQTATRAERDGADDETIACALLHDIGDVLAPANHSQVAAALLAPYVSEKNYWIVKHHGLFQGYYWFHHYDLDRDARDKYREHEHYRACVDFCSHWDQPSFDPEYDALPLEHFAPLVRKLFAQTPASFF